MRTKPQPQSSIERPNLPCTTTAKSYGGRAVGIAEIQITLLPPRPNGIGRLNAIGISGAEVRQAGEAILRLPLFQEELAQTVQCRLVGGSRYRSRYGLALCVAL